MDIEQRIQDLTKLLNDAVSKKNQYAIASFKIEAQIALLHEIQKTGIKKASTKKRKVPIEKKES